MSNKHGHYKNESYSAISPMNTDVKMHNKILVNWIQQHVEKILYHDQVGFIPGNTREFHKDHNIHKTTLRVQDKNHMIISHLNRYRKSFWQNSTSL